VKKIKLTWVKSTIGRDERQKRTIRALGLSRLNQSVVHEASPQILGMVKKVSHLLTVEEVSK
jgi:large subunit ribosomal protein L30